MNYITSKIQYETNRGYSWKFFQQISYVIGGLITQEVVTGDTIDEVNTKLKAKIKELQEAEQDYNGAVKELDSVGVGLKE